MSSEAPISAVDIDQAVKRFEDAWRRGECPAIDDYCEQAGHRRSALLQALVVIDLDFRLRDGHPQRTEDYLREFPELQVFEQVILQLLRIEARWRVGPMSAVSNAAAELVSGSEPRDVGERSSRAALETAASGADLSVIGATRSTAPGVSDKGFSGETVSGRDAPSEARIPAGTLGRFRLVDAVGQGGFGTVFRAIDTGLGRVVAIKVPREGVLGSEREQERFIREAQSAAALHHGHIVSVYEVGGTREQPFIVSEFVRGQTLSKTLAARQFEPREAARIVRILADALQYAHERGVIHRDVKPANIMLDERGEPFLMDFGLARREGEALITVAGTILGTPAYMSPEQAEGKSVDARSDVYSLGVVLYELLTAERPFRGNVQSVLHQVIHAEPRSPSVENRVVPLDLARICLMCMHKLPRDRYASARELEEDLTRFLEGLPVQARPISLVARGCRWARRHPKTAILVAVAVALGLSFPVAHAVYTSRVENANQRLAEQAETARRAEEADRESRERLFVSKGITSLEGGDPRHALPWFAAALNQVPASERSRSVHRVRLITAMDTSRLAHTWFLGRAINSVARCSNRSLLAITTASKAATVLDFASPAGSPVVLQHPDGLWQCAFSPDGNLLATFCNDAVIRVWPTSSLASNPLILDSDKAPLAMCFDPTSRLLASATHGGAVRLWDVSTGRPRGPILPHSSDVQNLAFSADGSLLATACHDGATHVWAVVTATEVAALKHESGKPVNCVGFAPKSDLLYSAGNDGAVRAWEVKSGAQKFEFRTSSSVLHIAFSRDGTRLAAGCRDGGVHVWNLQTQRALPGDLHHEQRVSTLSFSKDGKTLVTGSLDKTVRVWNLTTGTLLAAPFDCANGITWAELTDDEHHVLTAGFDGFLRQWNLGGSSKVEHRCADLGALSIVQLSPNGHWLLLAGAQGTAQLCDLNAPNLSSVALTGSSGTRHAKFARDGMTLVLAGDNANLDVWDISKQPRRMEVKCGTGRPNDVSLSPDGTTLVAANSDGTAQVVSIQGGRGRLLLRHGEGLKRAMFSTDGQKIYTAGGLRICLWDAVSGHLLSEFHATDTEGEFNDCRLTPDGRFLLAIRPSTQAIVCDAATGKFIAQANLNNPSNVAFSADGTRLAAIAPGGVAGTWDVPTGEPLAALPLQRADATCCTIRGDGSLFATGSNDTTVRVWDATTGEPVSPLLEHTDRVIFVGFCDEGNQLVTVSADAVIRLWTLDDGTPSERLIHLAKATSGQRIDESGVVVTLKPDEIEAEWNAAAGDRRGGSR